MPVSTFDHEKLRNSRKKQDSVSGFQRNTNTYSVPKSSFSKRQQKKTTFMSITFRKLGCKGNSSSAHREIKPVQKNIRRKKTRLSSIKNPEHVVVDTPDVCCAPPGIGSASDVAPRPRTTSQISNNRQHSRVSRRTANADEISGFHALNTRIRHPHSHNHPPVIIFRQNFQFARDLELDGYDQYGDWRIDVDAMSYEQLLELSDRIGYVGTGLAEEKILHYVRKFKHSTTESSPLLISKGWRCTICQDGYKVDDEIGRLDCGHYHHIECIKQWLLQKNACPVCKSTVVHGN